MQWTEQNFKKCNNCASLKCLSNFWRSIEMLLINCKIKLKLKQTSHSVLSANGNGNTHFDPNDIIFTIEDTKRFVPVVTLSAKDNRNFLAKDLKDQ